MMFLISLHQRFSLFLIVFLLWPASASADKCLYISSYHQGYAWSDGVERGLRNTLEGKCELRQFDMDTKRNKSEDYKQKVSLDAKKLIEEWQPDVVITSDDNAARYLIKPYYKDHSIPFVFCGVNWSVDEYGFPYSNTTGIVEIAPIAPLFDKINSIQGKPSSAFYLGADTLTERKNLDRFIKATGKRRIKIHSGLASNSAEWIEYYKLAQQYDFIIVGSKAGINDWDKTIVSEAIEQHSRVMTVTNHEWMMPYSILGLTKIPEEHGEWAALAALEILKGTRPTDIPIVSNRKWEIWLNPGILQQTSIQLPESIQRKAKLVN